MAGRKSITLLNKRGHPIDRNYRYKSLKSAVRKAVALTIGTQTTVQIWHLDKGMELALVVGSRDLVRLHLPRPSTFYKIWAD